MDTVTEYPPHMQEYGLTLADYQYLEMPQQDGSNYTIHVKTQSGETEGLVFKHLKIRVRTTEFYRGVY